MREYLDEKNVFVITEAVWTELIQQLTPISESCLRGLLRGTGLPFEQPLAGVIQSSFDELEKSLLEMERVYTQANAMGDRRRARYCREVVIRAKDHARFAARRQAASSEKKAIKAEMVQWMLIWLENPSVFPVWVGMRRAVCPPTTSE